MKVLMIIIGLFLLSCNSKTDGAIIQTNIDSSNEPFTGLHFFESNLYLFGESVDKNNLVVYNTQLDEISKWSVTNFEQIKGKTSFSYVDEKNLYLVTKPNNKTNLIYLISRRSGEPELVDSLNNAHVKFFHYDLKTENYTVLLNPFVDESLYSNGYELVRYHKGVIIDSFKLNKNVDNISYESDWLYFLTKSRNSESFIYKINTSNFNKDSISKKSLRISKYEVEDENTIWILGEELNKAVLYCFKNGNLSKVSEFDNNLLNSSEVSKIQGYENSIAILKSETTQGAYGSSNFEMILSEDGGHTWSVVRLPIDYYVEPNVLIEAKTFIAYSGLGRVTGIGLER